MTKPDGVGNLGRRRLLTGGLATSLLTGGFMARGLIPGDDGWPATGAALAATPDPVKRWPIGDSLWVWRTGAADWVDVARVARLVDCRTVHLSIPPHERERLRRGGALDIALAPFLDLGIAVTLTGGAPGWANPDAADLERGALELIDLALSAAHARGVVLDIEPHASPAWKSGDPARREALAIGLVTCVTRVGERLTSAGRSLASITHPAYTKVAVARDVSLNQAILANVDAAIVMAYRNAPNETIRFAAGALADIDRVATPWAFGVTANTTRETPHVGYGALDWPRLRGDLTTLAALGRTRPRSGDRFIGTAINAYTSLRDLMARGGG